MNNYYEEKFDSLFTEFGTRIALEKIVEDLLYKSSQPKVGVFKSKFDMFWQSDFINLITSTDASNENYILALSQYIRFSIADKNICINYIKLDIESFILAVRYSGVILKPEHYSWVLLKEISKGMSVDRLCEFIQTVEYLQQQYKYRLEDYENIKNKLNIGQVTAMIFSSLYAYEYLIPHKEAIACIPYQYDENEDNSPETIWKVFDETVKSSKKNTKKITEKSLGLALKFKMMPFITGENMTLELKHQYEDFKKLIAIKVELINYKRNVLESYSFDSKVNYLLENSGLNYRNAKEKDNWSKKHTLLLNYWFIFGSKKLFKSDYIYRVLSTGENLEANVIALSKVFGVKEQLNQIYGINSLNIDGVDLNIFDIMLMLSLSQAHYLKDHIQKFEEFLYRSDSKLNALSKLIIHGFIIGENRMPMTFAFEKEKAKRMSSWILEGSQNIKLKKMSQILKFWCCDLYDEDDKSSYMQKPFYKIDDFIFQFPWLTAYQNVNTAVINYVRKLHKNRQELREETDTIEKRLAEKLQKVGFQVFCQYQPLQGNAGEIDIIAIYENHVIVAEVKSTYIKSSIQEIYEYRNFTLNKAAYQLTKKVEYVKSEFIYNYLKNIEDVKVHSWIVDTTLEFDHEYFDNHLKISLDEIIITLNGDTNFMSSIVNGSFEEKENRNVIDPLEFIQAIESNDFWEKQLINYDDYMSKMMDKLHV
ncbi:hypothetical protein F900_01201 [Acinetobacter modestus]|uniref:NERD domain-containing protein n=1 Tax=Acinetobacter modestus TaxID=1776740 RepID=N9M2I2_9GAMM|nr:NERD domain-containing protein [Acinetobacter modestus]ENX02753.1 hypothetical protein F900_01201 [Acinetobacter modestus]